MNYSGYSFTPINLAIEGTLDKYIDLYNFTKETYLNQLQEHPHLINFRDEFNSAVTPKLVSEFFRTARRRRKTFTQSPKYLEISERHFKRFDFFDPEKVKDFEFRKNFYESYSYGDRDEIKKYNDPMFAFHETILDFEGFLKQFKFVVVRAALEQMQETNPSYTIFQAIKDVDSCIHERMKKVRSERLIPYTPNQKLTEEPLYLYDSLATTACRINSHEVNQKNYYAKHIDGKRIVVLPAHYCMTCKKYLFGSQSLQYFKDFCGDFIVRTYHLSPVDGHYDFNIGESKLHKLGYNVINGKLSIYERQNKLVSVLESKQLTFFEIVSIIEHNIRTFEGNPRMRNAVAKWKEDLRFINDYVIKKNEKK